MDKPKSITISSRGKPELRILDVRGRYCRVFYRDLSTGRDIDNKFKIYIEVDGEIVGYLFIKLKEEGKYLVLEDRDVDRSLYVYNVEKGVDEPIFP
ncbi:TPA: hypothetical protein EYP83_03340 [Candidatus Geothermarchaeota archaeon]|nr:hypothetical protein [Candidatus Geothermarchaeota archaeon]HIQ13871.1 hypothetical protein [Thermoprotei archaeon]